jgi:hypothetical protein
VLTYIWLGYSVPRLVELFGVDAKEAQQMKDGFI